MTKSSSKTKAVAMPATTSQSLRIEKIENGYLAHHSSDTPRGYTHKTVFHAEKPQLTVSANPQKKGGKK